MLAIVSQWFQLLIKYMGGFISLPLASRHLDLVEFNLWLLFNTMGGFVLMFDLGVYPALLRISSSARNLDEIIQRAKNGVTKKVYDTLSVVAMLLLPLATGLYAYPLMTKVPDVLTAGGALLLMCGSLAIKLRNRYYEVVYVVNEKVFELRLIESAVLVVLIMAQVAVLFVAPSILALCAIELAASLGIFTANRVFCTFVEFTPCHTLRNQIALLTEAAKNGIGTVISILLLMYMNWLVGLKWEPAYVAAYLIYLKVFDAVAMVCQTPFYVKLPRLIAHIGDKELTARSSNREIKSVLVLLLLAVVAVRAVSPQLNRALNLLDTESIYWILKYLAMYTVTRRLGAMYMQMHNATGDIATHRVEIANGAIVVVISVLVLALDKSALLGAVPFVGYALGYLLFATRLWWSYAAGKKQKTNIVTDYLIATIGVALLWAI